MIKTKQIPHIFIFFGALFLLFSINTVLADHEAIVAGEVIPLADASLSHGENCDDIHYHGDLNGKEDPAPDGCGHGVVDILPHNDDDESIVPKVEEETEEEDTGPGFWSKVGDWFDVVAQMFGAPPPKTISDSVDIVVDASESIAESTDNIEEYRESVTEDEDTLGLYDHSTDGLEKDSLAQKFFNWVYGN